MSTPREKTPTTRVVKVAEDRRAEIIEAAATLFRERGYEATTVNAIIDSVGIAKGTFYHHFESKLAVLDAWVEAFSRQASEAAAALVADTTVPPLQRLARMMAATNGLKLAQRPLMLSLLRSLHSDDNLALRVRTTAASRAMLEPILCGLLQEANAAGDARCDRPAAVARIVTGMLSDLGEFIAATVLRGHPDDERALQEHLIAANEALSRVMGATSHVDFIAWDLVSPWFFTNEEQS